MCPLNFELGNDPLTLILETPLNSFPGSFFLTLILKSPLLNSEPECTPLTLNFIKKPKISAGARPIIQGGKLYSVISQKIYTTS